MPANTTRVVLGIPGPGRHGVPLLDFYLHFVVVLPHATPLYGTRKYAVSTGRTRGCCRASGTVLKICASPPQTSPQRLRSSLATPARLKCGLSSVPLSTGKKMAELKENMSMAGVGRRDGHGMDGCLRTPATQRRCHVLLVLPLLSTAADFRSLSRILILGRTLTPMNM